MKTRKDIVCGVLAVILALTFAACGDDDGGGGDIPVTFSSVTADGSSSQTTTQLTLTFSQAITGLTADDISLSGVDGVNKGTISGSGPIYTLPVSDFTTGGTLYVSVEKSGYDISGSPKSTTIYYYGGSGDGGNGPDITYTVARADGEDGVTDTTEIIFTFSDTVLDLTADDITITNGTGSVTKGALSGDGTSWSLAVTVATAGNVTVTISKTGIEAETKHVTVYKAGESAPTLTGITLNSVSVKKDYSQNEQLDLTGLVVTAAYSDNSSEAVTDYTSSPADGAVLSTPGQITVTITYTEDELTKTASFIVNVTAAPAKTLTGITLNTTSVNKDYGQNEQLDLSGLVVTANYSDSSSAAVVNYTTSPTNGATLSTTGQITVTVSYTEGAVTETASFIVNVTAAGTAGLYYYSINNNTAYNVSKGTVTDGVVYIPAVYNGLPVTEIGAFGETDITAIHIPNTITSIGGNAFYSCTSLNSITLPEGVTTIGSYAFQNCTGLDTVTFAGNSQLEIIGNGAFQGCTSLTDIEIPESVTSIGNHTFYNCTSLTGINIPAGVTSIGTSISSDNPSLGMFRDCTSLTTVTFAEGSQLQTIGNHAFSGCTGLTGITLPEGVTTIGSYAFQNCTSLTNITIPINNAMSIGISYTGNNTAFNGCNNIETITFIDGSSTTIGTWFISLSSITAVHIPASVTTISAEAFRSCTGLTTVTFAEDSQLQIIGNYAFDRCTSLTSITIPAGVISIGTSSVNFGTFSRCTSLATVTFAEGSQLETIDAYAFQGCTGLTSLSIPASVTSIGNYAFSGWRNTQTIYVEGFNTQAAADAAWGTTWRSSCNAVIEYRSVSEIEITKQPDKTEYLPGEQLDITGLEVTATYSSGREVTVTVTASDITGFNSYLMGEQTLTVTYEGKTATFTVTVAVINNINITVTNTEEWNTALNAILDNGNNKNYIIIVNGDVGVAGSTAYTFGAVTGLSVTLQGNGKLYLTSQGNMIRLNNDQTLYIDSANLTLQGLRSGQNSATQDNNQAVIRIYQAKLELINGTISGNTNYLNTGNGGGVFVDGYGTFIMRGGTISGNTASGPSGSYLYRNGGGVYVSYYGTFTMNGGTISGNTAATFGGGVYVLTDGIFTMNGGTISGNNAPTGGGVGVSDNGGNGKPGTFHIVNGTIYGSNETNTSLRNTGNPAALTVLTITGTAGIAEHGTFSGETWNSNGSLSNTDNTINVINGVLQ